MDLNQIIWFRKIDSISKSMNEPSATVKPLSLTLACEEISEAKVNLSSFGFIRNQEIEIISPQILTDRKLTWNTCNLDLCWWSEKSSQLKELLILRDFSICSLHGSGGFTDVIIKLLTFRSDICHHSSDNFLGKVKYSCIIFIVFLHSHFSVWIK